jgi:TolB-like protein/Tfp pilus assembly protein PilF
MPAPVRTGWIDQLRRRGVLRVAASYAVIAWLLLQIADVTFEPLGLPAWAMTALIVTVAIGFPVALLLAWFFELGDDGVTRDSAPADAPRPRVHGLRRYADVVVIGALLAIVAVLLVRQSDLGRPEPPAAPSIAVLAFANLSGDPAEEYFSDGLAEEVLDRLGRVPGLVVVARSSSFSFKGRDVDVREVAERLGVATVLEGAVRRDGRKLRLNAKLVDGRTGVQLWSGSFDREVNDVFAVQEELAQAVASAIAPVARGDAATQAALPPPTTSLGAYDYFLLARAAQSLRGRDTLRRSVEYLEQAVAEDPSFARAQAALANSLVLLLHYDREQDRDAGLRRAEAAVYKALSLDPDLSDAQAAYANLLRDTKRDGAETAYRRALELNPNNAVAWHDYGVWLSFQPGRREEVLAATRRSLELDPRSAITWTNYLGEILRPGGEEFRSAVPRAITALGDVPEALVRIGRVAAIQGYPVEALTLMNAARASGLPGSVTEPQDYFARLFPWLDVDPARVADASRAVLDRPGFREPALFMLIDVTGLQGDATEVEALLADVLALRGAGDPSTHAVMAFWLSVQGRYTEAARSLALAEPIPERPRAGGLGSAIVGTQALPALLRVYRATGREAEAREIADRWLARWRAERPADADAGNWNWADLAALEANEGNRDAAVELLQQALRWSDLPAGFQPSLPWFRSLEGHPGYSDLVAEREARILRVRDQMLAVDAAAPQGEMP